MQLIYRKNNSPSTVFQCCCQLIRNYCILIHVYVYVGVCVRTLAFAPTTTWKRPNNILSFKHRTIHPSRSYWTVNSLFSSSSSSFSTNDESNRLHDLRVAVVGGGPSGLLLTHRLLQLGAVVDLYEKRPRPNIVEKEQRAYALGVGIRGRTAIQSAGHTLWQAVTKAGFASERFILHVGPFAIRLRDERDSVMLSDDNNSNNSSNLEPSLLLFQSDLCRTMADQLDQSWCNDIATMDSPRLNMYWKCDVKEINLQQNSLVTETTGRDVHSYDLIVGCDGVNSVVRHAIADAWPTFHATQKLIPGYFKVVKLPSMPPALDPTAVQLIIPASGTVTAFVEPTVNGSCCVLFAGKNATDILFSGTNTMAIRSELEIRYPKLLGTDLDSAAAQMIEMGNPSQASSVCCNTYHYNSRAVLVGDAAHATGGVSGQGVNSALVDAALLADCLAREYDTNLHSKQESLSRALLSYSQRAVPEGKALYDLSFGPNPTSVLSKVIQAVFTLRDSMFKGRWGIGRRPLQTMLTTSLRSFADIRRERQLFYPEVFPDDADWNATLAELDLTCSEEQAVSVE